MDDNNNNYYEHKNGQQYHEFINFAIQGMNENAQFAIAIAVGIFGILAIFVTLDTHKGMTPQDIFWKNALWTKPQWIWLTDIVLSIAYWALVLFGIQSYVGRRIFEGLMGDYLKKKNQEEYFNDIGEIAKENKIANLFYNVIWSSNHDKKDRYKGMNIVLSLYIGIAFLLWLFIIIL